MSMSSIGFEPGDSALRVTSANRQAIKAWLAAQGISLERADSMRDATLYKAYAQPLYLRAMMTRGDYVRPGMAPVEPPHPLETIEPTPAEDALPPIRLTDPAWQKPSNTAVELLTAAMKACAAGPTITEERVVELIREHAPRILADLLMRSVS